MVTLIIPQSGRTFENFMKKIKDEIVESESRDIDTIIKIVKEGKKYKSSNIMEVMEFLNRYQYQNNFYPLSIFIDRKREERPYRIGFLGKSFKLKKGNSTIVRIEGTEPHNCSTLVSIGEADIALAGFDELLATTQEKLINPSIVTKWGLYNYNLPISKKIRIAGSAMLKRWNSTLNCYIQDFVGFFLISKVEPKYKYKYPNEYLKHLEKHKNIVFVKGRYTDMVRSAYPKLNVVSVHDVEDAVFYSKENAFGLEIVQSGNTLKKKNLYLLGSPLFLSESLFVANYYTYLQKDNKLKDILNILKPVGYFEDERLKELSKWIYALEKNLGDRWVNKPSDMTNELFVKDLEAKEGLRPYRLSTRYWTPNDNYKVDEAYETVEKAKKQLKIYFNRLKLKERG